MLADAATFERAAFDRPFDVCVAGAGPAGITVARTLAARGYDVALMEAGEIDFSERSQEFYRGEIAGLPQPPCEESRLRCFGGTSGHWEGKCRAFEPEDFAARPWMPLSGWPIGCADLKPWADETAAILDLEAPENLPDIPEPTDHGFRHIRWRMSPPTHFGEKFRDEIVGSGRILLGVRATLVDLRLGDGHGAVTAARFRSYGGLEPDFTVEARAFVLCLGGLENARALLNCRSQVPAGIGNGNDLVGRYFCDRPSVATGNLLLADHVGQDLEYFVPTEAHAAAEGISRCLVAIEPRHVRPPATFLNSLKRSASCISPQVARMVARLREHRVDCAFGGLDEYAILREPETHPTAVVGISMEQRLYRDSRVRLCDSTDAFGLNRLRLEWQLGEDDYHTMRTATFAFAGHVADSGIGRLKVREWLLDPDARLPDIGTGNGIIAGRQHMCTTRMSPSPATGVVDPDCRVHGLANLYIGGSSVFATPGLPKPTFTIVELALRLGDHLARQLA